MTTEQEKLVVSPAKLFAVQLGARLKSIRKGMKLKQSAFANLIGISSDTISSIETGRKTPSIETLRAIAERLGMTVSELLDFQDEPKAVFSGPLKTHIMYIKTKPPREIQAFHEASKYFFDKARSIYKKPRRKPSIMRDSSNASREG
ncbi:MAG: helix-turn-helix transcriptional regulator [Planctomycetota bacterium]